LTVEPWIADYVLDNNGSLSVVAPVIESGPDTSSTDDPSVVEDIGAGIGNITREEKAIAFLDAETPGRSNSDQFHRPGTID
jgi:hypothetical protein